MCWGPGHLTEWLDLSGNTWPSPAFPGPTSPAGFCIGRAAGDQGAERLALGLVVERSEGCAGNVLPPHPKAGTSVPRLRWAFAPWEQRDEPGSGGSRKGLPSGILPASPERTFWEESAILSLHGACSGDSRGRCHIASRYSRVGDGRRNAEPPAPQRLWPALLGGGTPSLSSGSLPGGRRARVCPERWDGETACTGGFVPARRTRARLGLSTGGCCWHLPRGPD